MSRFFSLLLGASFVCFFLNINAQSEGNPSSDESIYFDKLTYRFVGPTRGGRVTAIEGIPQEPFTFYMGATGGGVWKTEDAGTSWENCSDGQIKAGSIGAIAVAPSNSDIVYVGTGSAAPRGNISPGIGAYKSMDGGDTWQPIGLGKVGQIGKIVVHPQHSNQVYVAALGQIFGPNPERGVYRSIDGGENWENILQVSDSTGAIDLVLNPMNPDVMYAAMWRAERKPWTLVDGGQEGGIWKTLDGGNNWTKLEGGLPTGTLGKIGLAISPANPDRLWALVLSEKEEHSGLYRTDDAGKHWERINRDHKLRQRAWYYTHVTAHPTNENTVFVNNVNFFKSIDGGKNFDFEIDVPHGDNHGVWINPNNPKVMVQCNDGGACVTLNGGKTWSSQLNQPTSEFYRLTVDNQFPYRLYAGQQDNTTISVPSHPINGITSMEHWFAAGGSECGDVAVDPKDPNIIWAGSYSGELTVMDRSTGQVRQVTAYPHYTEGTEQRDLKYRWQWNFPIVISPYDSKVVYHGGNYVFKTTDAGQSWTKISPDLTRQMDQYHDIPGGPIQHDATGVEVYSSIFALEESPHKEGELWVGTDDGLMHLSKDGGASWNEITPNGMPFEGTVNKIELSSHQPGRAFAVVYNYRYNDFKPYVYRTNNYGESWKLLTNGKNGVPDHHFARAIAEDPDQKGLLYLGTEFGMYISFNDGASWQPLQLNLPHVPITDIEVYQKDLILSTQGRGFWILDDLSPLQQLNQALTARGDYFYQPRPTYRTNIGGYQAHFDVYLEDQVDKNDTIQLDILDQGGNIIRTYTPNSKNRLNKIKLKKGFNRLTWNLRHEGPELVKNLVTMVIRNPAPGPKVVPGTYKARLKVKDWVSEQAIEILPDPRWENVTKEAYQKQLDMAIEIRNLISSAHKRIKNIRSLSMQMKQTGELAKQAGHGSELAQKAEEINKRLKEVEALIIQNKAEASQDNINYPRVFSNHIGRLYSVVVNANDRPTGGASERFEDLKLEYQSIVNAYEKVIMNDIPVFNELLEASKVERLIIPEKVK